MAFARPGDTCKGVASIFLAAVVGAPSGLFVRILSDRGSGAWTIVAVRNAVYTLVIVAACLIDWRCGVRAQLRLIDVQTVAASVFLAAQSLAIVAGCTLTSVANVTLIINTSPVFCAIFDRIFLQEEIRLRTQLMIASSLLGVAIVIGGQRLHGGGGEGEEDEDEGRGRQFEAPMLGNFVSLVNPLSWAIYWTILRRRKRRGGAMPDTCMMMLLSGLIGGFVAVAAASLVATDSAEGKPAADWWVVDGQDLAIYLLYAGVSLPLAQLGFSLGPRYITSAEISCVKMSEVFMMPLCVYLYNGELPPWTTYLGGTFVLAGIVGHSLAIMHDEQHAASSSAARRCGVTAMAVDRRRREVARAAGADAVPRGQTRQDSYGGGGRSASMTGQLRSPRQQQQRHRRNSSTASTDSRSFDITDMSGSDDDFEDRDHASNWVGGEYGHRRPVHATAATGDLNGDDDDNDGEDVYLLAGTV